MGPQKFKTIGLILVFSAFIALPFANNFLHFIKDAENIENRSMAAQPVFDVNFLDPFPEHYEKFYNDAFSLRFRFIKYFNNLSLDVYKKSPFPEKVVVGNNGWLYLGGNELKTYLGQDRLTIEQLEAWRLELIFQKTYLEKRGCKFYFMITPSKANIHSENVPYTYYRFNTQSWAEQLMAYLKKYSDINVISLVEPFRALKENEQLYYRNDNHWNVKGAFYGANIAATHIQKDFPTVKPLRVEDFDVEETQHEGGDILAILGDNTGIMETDYRFTSKKTLQSVRNDSTEYVMRDGIVKPEVRNRDTHDTTRPNFMRVSDSYARLFFPYIAESFNKSVKVFDCWRYHIYNDLVEREKPDVYLLMIFEGWLKSVPGNRAWLKDQKAAPATTK